MRRAFVIFFALLAYSFAGVQQSAEKWQEMDLPDSNVSLRGLSNLGGRSPIVVTGTHGTFALWDRTSKAWTVKHIPGAEQLDLRGVDITFTSNRKRVWLVISSGPAEEGQAKVMRSEDDGEHWTTVWSTKRKGIFLDSISMLNESGYILGDPVNNHFFLLRTSDAGKTWSEASSASMPAALPGEGAFAASNSNIVYDRTAVSFVTGGASKSRFFQSRDGGKSWQVVDTPIPAGKPSAGIFSLSLNSLDGIISGGDYLHPEQLGPNVAITHDGGRHWTAVSKPFPYRSSAYYLRSKYVVAGPSGSEISTDGGNTWRELGGSDWNVIRVGATACEVTIAGMHGKVAHFQYGSCL